MLGRFTISILRSSGHWLLKAVCRIAEPVVLEGQRGADARWGAVWGVALENCGKRVETITGVTTGSDRDGNLWLVLLPPQIGTCNIFGT